MRDITEVLREMATGETREFAAKHAQVTAVPVVTVTKYGKDEFRVCHNLPTSYPNTVRLLRTMGVEEA